MGLTMVSLELESQRLGFGYQVDNVVDALLDAEEGVTLTEKARQALQKTHDLLELAGEWDASSAARPRISAALFFSTAIPMTTQNDEIIEITAAAKQRMKSVSATLSCVLEGTAPIESVKDARGFFEAVADETLKETESSDVEEEMGSD